jgi:amino acid adenylation domain-containing protein
MIIGILGILKAGGVYLPIDPDYPEERKQYMLKDSNTGILVSEVSGEITVIDLKDIVEESKIFPTPPTYPTHLSYIMYTSGSTGRPKGVMVNHRNVVRLVKNTNYVSLTEETRILQTGAPVFDATTFEIWGSLLNGGQLVLVNKEIILDAHLLGEALKDHQVNTLWLSAPLFNQLMQQNIELRINRVKQRFPGLKIINGYGPTENTTFSTTHLIEKEYEGSIPIGRPIANSTAYIVDKQGQLQPVGVWGELVVGGDGVSMGYLNSPELTNSKFQITNYKQIPNCKLQITNKGEKETGLENSPLRFSASQLLSFSLYRTGDLARWLPSGTIEFKGRIDRQVKIRGFRIELEEIENQLLKHPQVKEAVVTDGENEGEKYLCAYVVPHEAHGAWSTEHAEGGPALKEFLSQTLPAYMIPSFFIPIDKIPLNPNGKIDRKSLPEPGIMKPDTGVAYTAPRDALEKQLAEIWAEVLDIGAAVGIDDNFFDLGGHSLNATTLAARMHKAFHVKIPLVEFFVRGCIREVAQYIKEAGIYRYRTRGRKRILSPLFHAETALYPASNG